METQIPKLSDEQFEFLKSRLNDRATIQVGWIGGVSSNLKIFNQYYSLYKQVDPLYQADLYCDACAIEMGKRVWNWYGDQVEARMIAEQEERDAQRVLLPEPEEIKQEVENANTEEAKPAGKKGKGKASSN